MEDKDIIRLWKSYDKKLDESLVLNRKQAEEITRIKVKHIIASMTSIKWFTLITGILWVGFGTMIVGSLFLFAFQVVSKYFLFSAAIQLLLTAVAVIVYLYQIILIYRVDIIESVVETQQKLARLRSSTLWVTRVLFLQLPVWTTFYWSNAMWEHAPIQVYLIQGIITGAFLFAAIWLFLNIKFENKDKKWFRLIFKGSEWDPILKSQDLLKQVNDYLK